MSEPLKTKLEYYGISPWEIEVLYGFLNSRFTVLDKMIEPNDENFVSYLDIDIPLEFNEAFFKWFDFKRWEKVKDALKEYKRRRGSRNPLKIKINFIGKPKIIFIIDVIERQWFNNAVEKMDFVIELLPHHLDPGKIPKGIIEANYKFDVESIRWRLDKIKSAEKEYVFRGDIWEEIKKEIQ
ncbi:MAG TPA: hypothetical protein QF456_00450 [Nitrosopumilus sp.]|nr:hypothetical protein [Nitrosopumilus sp.]